jgi:PAS domain S-box-containing protein
MFTAAATGIAISTPDGHFLQANAAYCQMLGYTEEELLTRDFASLTHPDDLAVNLELRDEMLAGQRESFVLEKRYRKKSGDIVWARQSVSAVRTAGGQIVRFIVIAEDTTEGRRMEAALRQSEARHRSLFENMIEGYCFCRLLYDEQGVARDYVYVEVNGAFAKQCGLRDVVGKKVSEIVPGMHETNPEQLERYSLVAATGQPERFETYVKPLGIWFSISVYSPEKGHFIAVFDNITERKRSEARFRRLVDSNIQGVLFWSRNGEITGANDTFLKLVHHTREDLEAGLVNWVALTPPEYADRDERCLREIEARGYGTPYEKEFLLEDGTRVPILLGSAAFEDNPKEGVCFVLDLTERKNLEQQFLRAQRMESIGTLAGGIAHDLNNSFGPIIMALDLLEMRFTDADSQKLIATVAASARHGASMVRQVLSFARGVEGERVEAQFLHLVREMEKIARDTFPRQIEVRTNVPNGLWTVLGDPTQLHQVLLNLCVNARDAMPDGGTLTISAENRVLDAQYAGLHVEAQPGPYLLLQVEDNGCGMPAAVMEKIFDPFFTTKEVGKGTGLGLSTTMSIVKSHGGFIRVHSELRKGTKFHVYLPAQTSPGAAGEEVAPELPRGHGELILVVDDEDSVRQITQQTLEAFGYRVVAACDGADAVATFARHRTEVAAVLTDMMMPLMDGPATIRALRKLNPRLPIVAASGLSAENHVAHAARLGINHFLGKPYTSAALLRALQQMLPAKTEDAPA